VQDFDARQLFPLSPLSPLSTVTFEAEMGVI